MPEVLLSVVIPTHNQGPYLAQTLESVLSQSYPRYEIIVVDDGSTDDTPQILQSYSDRLRVIRLEGCSGGPAKPRNVGINVAQGKFVALFDSDDLMLPGKLEEETAFLEAYPNIPLVFTNFTNFNAEGDYPHGFLSDHQDFQKMPKERLKERWYRLGSISAYETLISDTFVGTSSILFRKSLTERIGGFDESLSNSDDVDFFFRVTRSFDIGFIDKVYHKRRIHSQNISSRQKALLAKFRVYSRLESSPLSPQGQKALREFLGKVLFSLGYSEKLHGEPVSALKYYAKSLKYDSTKLQTYWAMAKAMIPYAPHRS